MKNQPVAKDAAFRSGDDEEFRRAKYDERRAIARTKAEYKDKLDKPGAGIVQWLDRRTRD